MSAAQPDGAWVARLCETLGVRVAAWEARMHAPPRRDAAPLLRRILAERASGAADFKRSFLLGATHAGVCPEEAAELGLVDGSDAVATGCRVFSGKERRAPLDRALVLVDLRPYGLGSFRSAPPFWGCVRPRVDRWPDLAYSIRAGDREALDELLLNSEDGMVSGTLRRYRIVRIAEAPNPPGVAAAVRRARLGCVFEVAGEMWAAIETREGRAGG